MRLTSVFVWHAHEQIHKLLMCTDSICSPKYYGGSEGPEWNLKTNLGQESRGIRTALQPRLGWAESRAQGRHGSLSTAHLRTVGGYRTRWLPVALHLEDMWWAVWLCGAEPNAALMEDIFHSPSNQRGLVTENESILTPFKGPRVTCGPRAGQIQVPMSTPTHSSFPRTMITYNILVLTLSVPQKPAVGCQ